MYISYNPNRHIAAATLFVVVCLCSLTARGERPDTLGIRQPDLEIPSFMIPHPIDSIAGGSISPGSPLPYANFRSYLPDYNRSFAGERFSIEPFDFRTDIPTSLFGWSGGSITASGRQTSMPGLMGIESGRISVDQTLGNLMLTAWIGADKYGWFRGLETSYGLGGSATYTFSPRWSATVFGEFHTMTHPLTPAIAEMMNSSRFGGYASYNFNDHWGVSVGAQAIRSLVTNRWEARPIVTPYYRINKSVSIGIDVGGILYNVAKDYIDSKNRGNYAPAGAPPGVGRPPVPTPARVSPRR